MSLWSRDVVPSTAVTTTDHGAIAKVVAGFCASVSLTFLCTRLLIRWPWRQLLGLDDAITFVATACGIVQMAVVVSAVSAGLGKVSDMLSTEQEIKALKLLYASDLLYVLTMYVSRLAVVGFFYRLEKSNTISLFAKLLAASCGILALVSIIIIATQQSASPGWELPSNANAPGVWARWAVVEIIGDLYDLAIIAYPIYLVYDLRMRTSMKVKVVMGIFFRIPILAVSILRLISLSDALKSSTFLFAYIDTEVLTQVEMCFTLVSATVPTMRIFLRAAKSSLLGETVRTQMGNSYAMGSRSRSVGGPSRRNTVPNILPNISHHRNSIAHELFNRVGGETITRVTRCDKSDSLTSDSSERAIVMQQTVDVEVDVPSKQVMDGVYLDLS